MAGGGGGGVGSFCMQVLASWRLRAVALFFCSEFRAVRGASFFCFRLVGLLALVHSPTSMLHYGFFWC